MSGKYYLKVASERDGFSGPFDSLEEAEAYLGSASNNEGDIVEVIKVIKQFLVKVTRKIEFETISGPNYK